MAALAGKDGAEFDKRILQLLDEMHLHLSEGDGTDADVLAFAHGVGLAWHEGALQESDLEQIEHFAEPVLKSGPSQAAGSMAYLVADAACLVGQEAKALAVLEDCAERYPDDDLTVLQRSDRLAQIYARQGRVSEAQALITDAIERAEAAKDGYMLSFLHGTRAQIGFDIGLFDRAVKDLQDQRRYAKASGDVYLEFDSLTSLADFYLGASQFEPALAALDGWENADEAQAAILAVYRAGALRHIEGREAEGEVLLEKAIASRQLSRELLLYARQLRVWIALNLGRDDDARARMAELDEDLPLAVETFTSGRAGFEHFNSVALRHRVKRQLGDAVGAEDRVLLDAAFDALRKRWDGLPRLRGGTGRLLQDRWRRVPGELAWSLMAQTPGSDGVEKALGVMLEVQRRASLARALVVGEHTVADVQRALEPGHGALVLFPSEERTLVFLIESGRVQFVDIDEDIDIRGHVREANRLLGAGAERDSRLDQARQKIGDLVLKADPVAAALKRWSAVTIVGADLLAGVPFEVLSLPGETETLGERLAIDHVASLGSWLKLRSRAAAAGPTAFWATLGGLAGPELGPADGPSRPGAFPRSMVDRVREACGDRGFRGEVDDDFTPGALLDSDLASVGCLHLLAHGAWDDQREIGAVLRAMPDDRYPKGVLSADVVERLEHVPPIVFLSSCRAGRSVRRDGDGHYNTLAGVLLRKGARAVIMSPDELDLREHIDVIVAFHEALDSGASPAEAMRLARRVVLADERSPRTLREARLQVVGFGH